MCKCGREIISEILESYDEELREGRDKKEYRSKGKRRRTIKTVMGEVEFERNVYERKKYGSSKEMKLAIAYDGAIERAKGRYNLSNKVACADFEGVNKFVKRKEGVIASTYNVDETESRVLNGDSAEWIKKSIADEDTHFQLDPFHRNKAIYTNVKDKRKRALLFELLWDSRVDDVFSCVLLLLFSPQR